LISNRSRLRAPSLTTLDRFVLGLTTSFMRVLSHLAILVFGPTVNWSLTRRFTALVAAFFAEN
jgi:hypothetical protein